MVDGATRNPLARQQHERTSELVGTLMGYRSLCDGGHREIVAIREEQRPHGPAAKSIVSITSRGKAKVGSYVPWINYYDLDQISRLEPGEWTIVEPGEPYRAVVTWDPYRTLGT